MDYTPDQLKKIQGFDWGDDEEDSGVDQPEMETCDKILSCAEAVGRYVVDNIDLMDLQQDEYSVNVPVETHPLLAERFNSDWSEYSRSRIFDFIRAVFIQKMEDLGYVRELTQKVQQIFPNKVAISHIDFFDDPEVDVTVTEKIVDLVSGSEQITGQRTTHSGNSITVTLKIDLDQNIDLDKESN